MIAVPRNLSSTKVSPSFDQGSCVRGRPGISLAAASICSRVASGNRSPVLVRPGPGPPRGSPFGYLTPGTAPDVIMTLFVFSCALPSLIHAACLSVRTSSLSNRRRAASFAYWVSGIVSMYPSFRLACIQLRKLPVSSALIAFACSSVFPAKDLNGNPASAVAV